MQIQLEPIGVVHNDFGDAIPDGWETPLQRIIVETRWTAALDGLEDFSHLYVLFWMHRLKPEIALHVHPQGRPDLPEVGMFATRTPHRPNPIGVQIVELVSRHGNVLTIRRLDALDGSPVLDIKPYLPGGDSFPQASFPDWLGVLQEKQGR